jgi:hypothetical protein
LARALCRAVSSPRARLGAATGLICSVVFIAAVAPRIQFVDDAEALSRVSPTWLLEDQLVRGAVGRFDAARFVVVQADTVEAALERNDAVARALEEARATGVIAEYRSLHAFLWSEAVQRRNLDALRSALQDRLVVRLRGAFSDAGLRGDAFAVGWDEQQAPLDDEGSVLRWSDLVGSPLAPLVSPFVIELEQGHGVAMTSYVRGVSDLERLRSIVEAVDGARLFDRRASMRAAWRAHRQQIGRVAGLGLVGVTLLVLLRHRQIGKTIRAVAPALLAAAFTLCVRSLVGPSLHLLDVIAALLVLSMGADYGVFLVEGSTASAAAAQGELGSERDADAATLLAMMLAFATTTWGFGTLALATNPAMQAIGLTTAIGVASALVFAVLVHVVAAGWPAPPHGSRASADRPPSRAARGRSSTLLMGVLLCGAAACAGPAGARARRTTSPEGPVDPEALPFDAALRQTVSATRDRDTRSLEVALEIRRERVVLVGVLPFGGRVFTIVATRAGVDTTVHLPGHVPIDARLVFDDMARALLVDARRVWSGPPPRRGVRRGHAALGDFEERWQDGCVVSRRFVGRDPLAITYDDPWCTGALPRRLRLERPRIGLTIRVETLAGEIEARAP